MLRQLWARVYGTRETLDYTETCTDLVTLRPTMAFHHAFAR
jgi:hypothetical protein